MVPPAAGPLIKVLWYVAVRMTLVLVEYKEGDNVCRDVCLPRAGIFIQGVVCTYSPSSPGSKLVLIAEICNKSHVLPAAVFEDLF